MSSFYRFFVFSYAERFLLQISVSAHLYFNCSTLIKSISKAHKNNTILHSIKIRVEKKPEYTAQTHFRRQNSVKSDYIAVRLLMWLYASNFVSCSFT